MAVTVRTPLCTDLGIDYPIVSVGFSLSAGPELVAAVTAGHRPARHTIPLSTASEHRRSKLGSATRPDRWSEPD